MGKSARPGMGRRQLACLGLAGGLVAASLFATARPVAQASPGGAVGPVRMNPTSWNPTDNNEPFESSGPFAFDSRVPEATRTGPSAMRSGIGNVAEACQRVLNTWGPIEPAYLTWRVKVENTDDYFAAEPEADKLSFYLNVAHGAVTRGLAGVPGYAAGVDPLRAYDMHVVILQEMIDTGGGRAPFEPDVRIPWERWDVAWDNLSHAHDEILKACPSR